METRPLHRYLVSFGDGREFGFHEASGLEPHTAERAAHPKKIPGIHKVGDVTLKRGVIASDAGFWDWYKHSGKSQTVVVKLLDERSRVTATWKLIGARPVKFTAPDLNAKGNDVAIESVELTYEAIEIVT